MTEHFNFRSEVLHKYDQETYDVLMDSFDNLPLVCILNGRYVALHGGISPEWMEVSIYPLNVVG
jgi:serine/threonine-protein phosphatase 2B catalytic subunit